MLCYRNRTKYSFLVRRARSSSKCKHVFTVRKELTNWIWFTENECTHLCIMFCLPMMINGTKSSSVFVCDMMAVDSLLWHALPGRAAVAKSEPPSSCEPWEVFEGPCWGCALFCLILTLPLSAGLLLITLSLLAASSSPSQDDRCVWAWLLSKTRWMCAGDGVIPLGVYCMWRSCISVSALSPRSQTNGTLMFFVLNVSPCDLLRSTPTV